MSTKDPPIESGLGQIVVAKDATKIDAAEDSSIGKLSILSSGEDCAQSCMGKLMDR